MKSILGKKLGMTQLFDDSGAQVPVTAIQVGPCVIVQRKTQKTDGVDAVQLGFGEQKEQRLTKPMQGHLKKAGVQGVRLLREVRVESDEALNVGDKVDASIFAETAYVDVIGTSKGRGFQGVVKRHGMGGGRASHGGHDLRGPGSIGMKEMPARVFKNKPMPGHMGHERVTVQNLKLVKVAAEENVIFVRGAIPGPTGGVVMVRVAIKKTGKAS